MPIGERQEIWAYSHHAHPGTAMQQDERALTLTVGAVVEPQSVIKINESLCRFSRTSHYRLGSCLLGATRDGRKNECG